VLLSFLCLGKDRIANDLRIAGGRSEGMGVRLADRVFAQKGVEAGQYGICGPDKGLTSEHRQAELPVLYARYAEDEVGTVEIPLHDLERNLGINEVVKETGWDHGTSPLRVLKHQTRNKGWGNADRRIQVGSEPNRLH
jgi:hypothetical protein